MQTHNMKAMVKQSSLKAYVKILYLFEVSFQIIQSKLKIFRGAHDTCQQTKKLLNQQVSYHQPQEH